VYPVSSTSAFGGQNIGKGLVTLWVTLIVIALLTALAPLVLLGNCAVLVWQTLNSQVVDPLASVKVTLIVAVLMIQEVLAISFATSSILTVHEFPFWEQVAP
jgi:hypothetical protein